MVIDWTTPANRIRWLVDTRFDGNRSAFAEAVGCSHTLVFKVIGGQAPGRRFLEAIAGRLDVNMAWLLSGEGQPGPRLRNAVPLAIQPLPGPPHEYASLLADGIPNPELFTSSQYWLHLTSNQPIIKEATSGFRVGDNLLMETDLAKFPRQQNFYRLCSSILDDCVKLGMVTHYRDDEDEYLEVDTYEDSSEGKSRIKETTFREFPDGTIRKSERSLKLEASGREAKPPRKLQSIHPKIKYTDIVAVWTRILHRP